VGASGSALCACPTEHHKIAEHTAALTIFILHTLARFDKRYHIVGRNLACRTLG